ncbi:hypothetical protein ABB02_00114 [Clostridiaceae bacterium JG1575]|nr:hypothetical protein ABB02_00114 [Clostridiaceae bacterium JG1575]
MKRRKMPVDVLGWFDFRGELTPVRFQCTVGKETLEGRILQVVGHRRERLGNENREIFTCLIALKGRKVPAELVYLPMDHRWLLQKM